MLIRPEPAIQPQYAPSGRAVSVACPPSYPCRYRTALSTQETYPNYLMGKLLRLSRDDPNDTRRACLEAQMSKRRHRRHIAFQSLRKVFYRSFSRLRLRCTEASPQVTYLCASFRMQIRRSAADSRCL